MVAIVSVMFDDAGHHIVCSPCQPMLTICWMCPSWSRSHQPASCTLSSVMLPAVCLLSACCVSVCLCSCDEHLQMTCACDTACPRKFCRTNTEERYSTGAVFGGMVVWWCGGAGTGLQSSALGASAGQPGVLPGHRHCRLFSSLISLPLSPI